MTNLKRHEATMFEFRAKHLYTTQHNMLSRHINDLLKTDKPLAMLKYPEVPEDYVEPTLGQCIALQAKNKTLLIEQADGNYLQLRVGEKNKLHRCPVTNEALQAFLQDQLHKAKQQV